MSSPDKQTQLIKKFKKLPVNRKAAIIAEVRETLELMVSEFEHSYRVFIHNNGKSKWN